MSAFALTRCGVTAFGLPSRSSRFGVDVSDSLAEPKLPFRRERRLVPEGGLEPPTPRL
jgi:hypothetical protein